MAATVSDLAHRVESACGTAHGAVGVERAVAAVMREAVPFDRWCVLTVDPAVALATGGYHDEGLPQDRLPRLSAIESRGEDVLALRDLARARVGVLSHATRGALETSARYREVFAPSGVEHEMRLVFTIAGNIWGALVMLRGPDVRDFSVSEADLAVRSTTGVATAIRRELLLSEIDDDRARHEGPGLVLLDAELRPRETTAAALRWLSEIDDGIDSARELPVAVISLACRARDSRERVWARMRTRTGAG